MMSFTTFTRFDWDAFAGAEAFADGKAPLIAQLAVVYQGKAQMAACIVDATGVSIEIDDGDVAARFFFEGADSARAVAVLGSYRTTAISEEELREMPGAQVFTYADADSEEA